MIFLFSNNYVYENFSLVNLEELMLGLNFAVLFICKRHSNLEKSVKTY